MCNKKTWCLLKEQFRSFTLVRKKPQVHDILNGRIFSQPVALLKNIFFITNFSWKHTYNYYEGIFSKLTKEIHRSLNQYLSNFKIRPLKPSSFWLSFPRPLSLGNRPSLSNNSTLLTPIPPILILHNPKLYHFIKNRCGMPPPPYLYNITLNIICG